MQIQHKLTQTKQISAAIINRENMFNTSKGGMINNILNRSTMRITLDHVIEDGEYYSDPEEIKMIAVTKAKKWTRKKIYTINII